MTGVTDFLNPRLLIPVNRTCTNLPLPSRLLRHPTMVAQSLSSLLQRATIDDHEEVIQSCNDALAKSKSDLQVQHIKIIALLKLDRFEDSLRVFETGGDALKDRAGLEYGYVLYKCGQLERATEALSHAGASRGARHLEAQVVRFIALRNLLTATNLIPRRATGLRNSAAPPKYTRSFTEIQCLPATKKTT